MAARARLQGLGGYEGGARDRRGTRNWRPRAGSADADILPDLPTLRARSRDLARNVPVACGAISTNVTHIVGDGLRLQAAVDRDYLGLDDDAADQWEKAAEREWKIFCRSADFTGAVDFQGLQPLSLRAVLESGDVFVVRRFVRDGGAYGTRLVLVEADRVSNPGYRMDTEQIAGGIELSNGVPVAIHVTRQHPGAIMRSALHWDRIPIYAPDGSRAVLHLYEKLRPGQTRGVPYLAPVIEYIRQLGDYFDAEVRAAVISAFYTVFVTSPVDQQESPIAGTKIDNGTGNEIGLGAGAVIGLAPGEDVKFANPGRPNAQFDPFVLAFLRQIGVALELPFELLIKHFTASYSASRAALEMAWQFFRVRRVWLGKHLCQAVYEWFLDEAVASGRLSAPGYFSDPAARLAYSGAQWIGPARPTIDPVKDAQADQSYLGMKIVSREEIRAERFGDRGTWETLMPQIKRENDILSEAGSGDDAAMDAAIPAGQDGNEEDSNQAEDG